MTLLFGTCVGYPEKLRKYAAPSVQHNVDEPYQYIPISSTGHVPGAYETLRVIAASQPHVEALVLLHDDLEIRDPKFAQKIRRALHQPDVAIVGVIGARGVRSMHWWAGGPPTWRGYVEDGRDGRTVVDGGFAEGDPCDVDSVDGMMFAMSRWAIENLSFVPDVYTGLHGYVEEVCFQARAKGKRVVVSNIDVFHHTQGGYAGGNVAFEQANQTFMRRWGFA